MDYPVADRIPVAGRVLVTGRIPVARNRLTASRLPKPPAADGEQEVSVCD